MRTARIGTKNVPWLHWQRRCQVHPVLRLLTKPEKWANEWSQEKQISILEDSLYCFRMALQYKDRGYHKIHRKYRNDAKTLLRKLNNQ
jgi:hypothetical protein